MGSPPFPPASHTSYRQARFLDISDVFTEKATLLVAGFAVGSVVDWDWPVDTLWVSTRALADLGVQDGEEIGVSWARSCGQLRAGQPVTVRVASNWHGTEAMLAVARDNPTAYCRVYWFGGL